MNQPHFMTLGLSPSFGFGDRTGLATAGHAMAMREWGNGIEPIFAQQSVRELDRTGRTPRDVVADVLAGLQRAGWNRGSGADADHLKSAADVDHMAAAGFTFYTIDPSDHVDARADDYSEAEVRERFAELADDVPWIDNYRGAKTLSSGAVVEFTSEICQRAAVKYGRAIRAAVELSACIARAHGKINRPYEIELSIDETPQPTSLAEHYIIASECLKQDMRLVSLAPRFIGAFEKGVDYRGDLKLLEKSLADHAAIAQDLGPYKLSLHSGSDKLSIYAMFARATRGRFHIKTSGTSYLESLRVVLYHDRSLFRRIVEFARSRYESERASYHVSAQLAHTPAPADLSDDRGLECVYLGRWLDVPPGRGFSAAGRQILHCTYGSVMSDDQLGPAIRSVLQSYPDSYDAVISEHFKRHLTVLTSEMEKTSGSV